jgi:hypothetical protein
MSAQPNSQDPIGHPIEEHETISLSDEKVAGTGKTKLVQNAALSQATAIAKPSMLTWRMFQVRMSESRSFYLR